MNEMEDIKSHLHAEIMRDPDGAGVEAANKLLAYKYASSYDFRFIMRYGSAGPRWKAAAALLFPIL